MMAPPHQRRCHEDDRIGRRNRAADRCYRNRANRPCHSARSRTRHPPSAGPRSPPSSAALKGLTDEAALGYVKIGPNEVARGLMIAGENAHANEIYGTMAVYLRLKGIVPPSTERAQTKK